MPKSFDFRLAPGHLIRRAHQVSVAIFMEETAEFGVTPVQFAILSALIGQPSAARPDVSADTSPSKLLPNGAVMVMITGAVDTVTPPLYAQTYVDEVHAAGGAAELVIVPDATHFDVVTIGTPAWRLVSDRIVAVLEK